MNTKFGYYLQSTPTVIDHSKYSDSAIAALVFGHMMNIVEDFERFFLIKIQ